MKTLTKSTLAVITAALLSTSAFANSSDDSPIEQVRTAKAGVEALATTLKNEGVAVDTKVNLDGARTYAQKEAVYQAKYSELQAQFDAIHQQNS